MAGDVTRHNCKYYTYNVKSEFDCFKASWTIIRYSKLEIGKEYTIPPFKPMQGYHLELIFRKSPSDIYLYIVNKNDEKLISDVNIAILDVDGKELHRLKKTGVELIKNDKRDVMPSLSKTEYELFNSSRNDTVTLDIEFRIEKVLTYEAFEEGAVKNSESKTKLLKDLEKYIREKNPTDVVLKTKDSQTEANKGILCARSSVFKKMFENPLSEHDSHTVLIDDLMGSTLKILVDFFYTGEVDLNIEFSQLKELYYAADKYDVLDLREMSAANILRVLTEETVREVLEMAVKHSDEHLKKGCILFIERHIFSFLETDYWKDLKASDPYLALEIFEFHVRGISLADSKA